MDPKPGSFGSLELKPREGREFIGQEVSYETQAMRRVIAFRLDSVELARVDLMISWLTARGSKLPVSGTWVDTRRPASQLGPQTP